MRTDILEPMAKISSNFKKPSSLLVILISNLSKDKPSPSAKSARPPKSARDKSFTTPGAFTTLKSSIINFEEDALPSIIDENVKIPPDKPLKKVYSESKGWGKSE